MFAWRNEAQVKAAYMSATGKEQDESDAFLFNRSHTRNSFVFYRHKARAEPRPRKV